MKYQFSASEGKEGIKSLLGDLLSTTSYILVDFLKESCGEIWFTIVLNAFIY